MGVLRIAALTGLLILSGCGAVSEYTESINPWSKEKILPGERKPLFEGVDPAEAASGTTASVGAAKGGQDWPQAGGPQTNDAGNLAISVSGARAWKATVGASGGGFTQSALRVSARPVAQAGRLFIYKPNGEVVALSASTGSKIWTRPMRPEGEDDVAPGGGVAVSGNRVFVATGYRQLAALDAASGQVIWTAELSTRARGAPAAGAGHVFVVTQSNEVYALKQDDGTEAWTFLGIEETAGVLSAASPAISGNTVVVPFSSGEVMALNIKTGEPVWIDAVARAFRTLAVSGLADVSASPVISGGTVYATGVAGRTIAASLKTGERQWEQNLGSVHTPVASGNALFMVDLDDRMIAINRETGDPMWSTVLPRIDSKKKRRSWAGPILANGTLAAVSNDGYLALVDAASGQLITSNKINSRVSVTPVVAGGRMVVLDGSDSIAAYN